MVRPWFDYVHRHRIEGMKEIAISKFKATCLAVLESVRKTGKPVRVTRFGKPVADVFPPGKQEPRTRQLGTLASSIEIQGDIVGAIGDESDWEARRIPRAISLYPTETMNLLLDTHIWLWSHREPQKLTPGVTADERLMNVPGIDVLPNR